MRQLAARNARRCTRTKRWAVGSIVARSAGAERRKMVAHGVSRGFRATGAISPGGATDQFGRPSSDPGVDSFARCVCRPCRDLVRFVRLPHGWRRGLTSSAAPQLPDDVDREKPLADGAPFGSIESPRIPCGQLAARYSRVIGASRFQLNRTALRARHTHLNVTQA